MTTAELKQLEHSTRIYALEKKCELLNMALIDTCEFLKLVSDHLYGEGDMHGQYMRNVFTDFTVNLNNKIHRISEIK